MVAQQDSNALICIPRQVKGWVFAERVELEYNVTRQTRCLCSKDFER